MKDKLEPNMYVRTKKGIIAKCTNILEDCSYDFDRIVYQDNYNEDGFMEIPYLLIDKYIIKASHNIIDLIEVGDYLNGFKVSKIERYDTKTIIKIGNSTFNVLEGEEIYTPSYDNNNGYEKLEKLKSIVTKEQFENMKYEVE